MWSHTAVFNWYMVRCQVKEVLALRAVVQKPPLPTAADVQFCRTTLYNLAAVAVPAQIFLYSLPSTTSQTFHPPQTLPSSSHPLFSSSSSSERLLKRGDLGLPSTSPHNSRRSVRSMSQAIHAQLLRDDSRAKKESTVKAICGQTNTAFLCLCSRRLICRPAAVT